MTQHDLRIILILLAINLAVAIVYLIMHLIRKTDCRRGIVTFVLFLVIPIVGEAFVLCTVLTEIVFNFLKKQGLDMAELSFSKKRMKLRQDSDIEKDLNKVPIEEALIVHDKQNKRSAFLDVLKTDDYTTMMHQVHQAVENDDQEVAHYAAVFVSDSLAKFKNQEDIHLKRIFDDYCPENLSEYISFCIENLNPEVLSAVELWTYVDRLNSVAWHLLEVDPDRLKDIMVVRIVELLSKFDADGEISKWVQFARTKCSRSLELIKLCARYYFKKGMRGELADIVDMIKMSSLSLDSETLDWFRVLRL